VQRRHNCSPAASFANCVMTLYLLKVHLQTFLSVPITRKCQIVSCDTLVANERYVVALYQCMAVTSLRHHVLWQQCTPVCDLRSTWLLSCTRNSTQCSYITQCSYSTQCSYITQCTEHSVATSHSALNHRRLRTVTTADALTRSLIAH